MCFKGTAFRMEEGEVRVGKHKKKQVQWSLEGKSRAGQHGSGDDVTTPELVITGGNGGDEGHQRVALALLQSTSCKYRYTPSLSSNNEHGSAWITRSSLKRFCLTFVHLFQTHGEAQTFVLPHVQLCENTGHVNVSMVYTYSKGLEWTLVRGSDQSCCDAGREPHKQQQEEDHDAPDDSSSCGQSRNRRERERGLSYSGTRRVSGMPRPVSQSDARFEMGVSDGTLRSSKYKHDKTN